MKRFLLIFAILLLPVSASAQAPVITQTAPVVNQGKTLQFTETLSEPGTWSCSGCAGGITAGGLYTAPATVTPQQSFGGYQLHPNNHIYNTRIDSLPVNPGSVLTIASSPTGAVRSGNVVTITTTGTVLGYPVGASIIIAGVTDNSFNGTFPIASFPGTCSSTCFSYSQVAGNATSGSGTAQMTWTNAAPGDAFTLKNEISFPTNYTNGSTPLLPMTFAITSGNNGNFQVPAFPNVQIEGGWLSAIALKDGDHHLRTIDTTTGAIGEMYQFYPACAATAASVSSNVATISCSTNPLTNGFYVTESVCIRDFSGADTYFNACPVTLTAATSSSVSYALTHANASASTSGDVGKNVFAGVGCSTGGVACNSDSGTKYNYSDYLLPNGVSTDAAGLELSPLILRLQEVRQAIATGTPINHAIRITLQNGYICGTSTAGICGQAGGTRHIWPATAEAFAGAGIVPYGARFRLKSSFNISGYSSIAQIFLTMLKNYGVIISDGGTGWASQIEVAPWPANIIAAMAELGGISDSNFEAVDESSLMISSASGETTNNRETVTFTRTSDSATATVDVALMGVAVGLTKDQMFIQAGTVAQQLTASVHGGNNNTVTWSWSPAITGGTLTSGGLLTPPATIAAVASTTITATSTDNVAIAASMLVWFFPTGSIYIRPGATSNYTDSSGHLWVGGMFSNTGGGLGCCGDLSGGPWPAVTDIAEYYFKMYAPGDTFFNFSVPNGTYNITVKLGSDEAPGVTVDNLESQGIIVYPNVDVNVAAGGAYKPVDYVITSTVTTGTLLFAERLGRLGLDNAINAIQIDRTGVAVATTLTPGMKVTSGMTIK